MVQYTAEFLAAARQGYEDTDQPMRELARELGIGITTLSTLAETQRWAKRSLRKRGLTPAMQLLVEAKALAVQAPHPSRLAALAPQDDGATLSPTLPLSGGGSESVAALVEGGETSAPTDAELRGKLMEILNHLIIEQHMAASNGVPSPQGSRNLTLLIQAARAMRGLSPAPLHSEITAHDDRPEDIDEFRRRLAQRIDAIFASRRNSELAEANSGCGNEAAG